MSQKFIRFYKFTIQSRNEFSYTFHINIEHTIFTQMPHSTRKFDTTSPHSIESILGMNETQRPIKMPENKIKRNSQAYAKSAIDTMSTWLDNNPKNPYPTRATKLMMCSAFDLTLTQVTQWFANARRRNKTYLKHKAENEFNFEAFTDALTTWLFYNRVNSFPTKATKLELGSAFGFTLRQINTGFIKARRRNKICLNHKNK